MTSFTDQQYVYSLSGFKTNLSVNPTYIYFAYGESDTPPQVRNTVKTQSKITKSIIGGKRVKPDHIFYMIRRIEWQSGRVFDEYNDDEVLDSKDFYVLASNRAVYKCISNNNGSISVNEPTNIGSAPFKTADGYVWKYMYRLTTDDIQKRMLPNLMPVRESTYPTDVRAGTIDAVSVEFGGSGYITFSGTVQGTSSGNIVRIPNNAPQENGIYTNSSFYVESGPGIGDIARITNYHANTSGRYVTLDRQLPVNITSNFVIAPSVVIDGDGEDFKARTIVEDGQIISVEIIDSGEYYTYGDLQIRANTFFGSGANVAPIISPILGHASQVPGELISRHISIFMDMNGNEAGTIPDDVSFTVYGLCTGSLDASNPSSIYNKDTFDATALIEVNMFNGDFSIGDKIVSQDSENKRGTVIMANNSHIRITYDNRTFFSEGDNILNQDGIIANILTISQPDIVPHSTHLLMGNAISTIERDPLNKESFVVTLSA